MPTRNFYMAVDAQSHTLVEVPPDESSIWTTVVNPSSLIELKAHLQPRKGPIKQILVLQSSSQQGHMHGIPQHWQPSLLWLGPSGTPLMARTFWNTKFQPVPSRISQKICSVASETYVKASTGTVATDAFPILKDPCSLSRESN